jgi:transposase
MLSLPPSTRIFVSTHPVDMRRSFDGLLALVRDYLGHDPFTGHLFIFRNKTGDRLKALWWDRDGLAIFYKRLEEGRYTFPHTPSSVRQIEMTSADLQLILQGIDPAQAQRDKRYSRPAAADTTKTLPTS